MYNLCCISEELKKEGVCFQSMTWARFSTLVESQGMPAALAELGSRWLNNVKVTHTVIKHCVANNWGYRVSSSLFPVLTHPDFSGTVRSVPQYQEIMDEFKRIRDAKYNLRLSCHPDQFNVLASNNQEAVAKTLKELNYHGGLLDLLGCPRDYSSPINIHINCTDGTPQEIAQRFMTNLSKCNVSVRSRLVVENEDKGIWNVSNLLEYVYKPYGIPVTFDNLHDSCLPSDDVEDCFASCAATWGEFKPLFHYSESSNGTRAHADLPTSTPYVQFGEDAHKVDFDVELKAKDEAIRVIEDAPLEKNMKALESLVSHFETLENVSESVVSSSGNLSGLAPPLSSPTLVKKTFGFKKG